MIQLFLSSFVFLKALLVIVDVRRSSQISPLRHNNNNNQITVRIDGNFNLTFFHSPTTGENDSKEDEMVGEELCGGHSTEFWCGVDFTLTLVRQTIRKREC